MSGGVRFRSGVIAAALGLCAASAANAQTIPLGPVSPSRNTPSPTAMPYARPANPAPAAAKRNDVTAPRLADLSPQSIGLQPLSGARATGSSAPAAPGIVAPAQPAQPTQAGQAAGGQAAPGSTAGQILTPTLVTPLAAATPLAYAGNLAPGTYGGGGGNGTAPARPAAVGGEGRGPAGPIGPEILQPTVLEQPREFAPPGQMLPVLALDEATLLGGVARPLEAPQPTGAAVGLANDALAPIPNASLGLASLAWEDGRNRLADLSLQVIPYGPPGPEAALGGFAPWRVLPWPNLGARGTGAQRPVPEAPSAYGVPVGYGSTLGLALSAVSQIGAHLGAGIGSVGQLPPLPHY